MTRIAASQHDPRLLRFVRAWLLWGTVAVLLLPVARMQTVALGWLPLYLVAMPASALWALHGFALPRWRVAGDRRRRRAPQARRRHGVRGTVLRTSRGTQLRQMSAIAANA